MSSYLHLTNKEINTPDAMCKVSIKLCRSSKFPGSLFGVKNTFIEIVGNSHKVMINYNKSLNKVEGSLAPYISHSWREQELETYIPALINKELDIAAAKYGKAISSSQKDNIRASTFKRTCLTERFKDVKNLNAMAQTSIGQTTATHLLIDSSLFSFFKAEKLSRELQSEITALIKNKIADSVYERVMGQSVHNIRRVVQQEARRELNSPTR